MSKKICFFIGHSDAPQSVYPELIEAVSIQADVGGLLMSKEKCRNASHLRRITTFSHIQ